MIIQECIEIFDTNVVSLSFLFTAWKVYKWGVFSGPYFPAFELNAERYFLSFRIQSECWKIRTRKNSLFGHFSRSASINIKSTYFFFITFFWYINWVFLLIFITKNTNSNGTLFFNFVYISKFDWKFYVFQIKLFGRNFISFFNSWWIMIWRI